MLGLLTLGLAACTTSISGVAASQSAVRIDGTHPSATSDGTAPTPTREPGLVVSNIGSPVALLGSSGEPIMTLTIEAIAVDPGCDGELALPSEYGHFVVVTLTIDVPATVTAPPSPFTMSPWHVLGPNGEPGALSYSISSYLCARSSDLFPGDLSVGTHTGRIVLDTPHASGYLTWTPDDVTATTGWSWSF